MQQYKEKAERVAYKEIELQHQLEVLQFDNKDMKTNVENMRRQVETAKSDKVELAAKLELAGQKIANLERENMKLFRLTNNADQQQHSSIPRIPHRQSISSNH